MKKIISFILVMFMLVVFVGCGTVTPEDTVSKFFKSVKVFNIEGIEETLVEGKTEEIVNTELFKELDENSVFLNLILDNMEKLSYNITDSEVDGNMAVVSVSTKYVDSGPLLKATFSEYILKAFGSAFSGEEMSDEDMEKMLEDIMLEKKKEIPETFKEVDLKIDLVKKDDEWLITEINDELLDVLMSGMYSTFNDFGESFQ